MRLAQVIRNDKDCFDAGIGEVKVLTALAKLDPEVKLARLELADYFYHREHLFIVTNCLNGSLWQFTATRPKSGERAWLLTNAPRSALTAVHRPRPFPLSMDTPATLSAPYSIHTLTVRALLLLLCGRHSRVLYPGHDQADHSPAARMPWCHARGRACALRRQA